MNDNTYYSDFVKVVKYLLEHRDTTISDDEIEKIAPKNGDAILNNLEKNNVLALTKDGVLFDTTDIDALKRYLKKMGINV